MDSQAARPSGLYITFLIDFEEGHDYGDEIFDAGGRDVYLGGVESSFAVVQAFDLKKNEISSSGFAGPPQFSSTSFTLCRTTTASGSSRRT